MDGMDCLEREVNQMRLSMEIIDGYNEKTKDYCASLIQRLKNAQKKKADCDNLLEAYQKAVKEQESIKKLLEEKKERLMSLQNIKFPKNMFTEDAELCDNNQLSKDTKNLEISPGAGVNTDVDKAPIANLTFLSKDMTNLTPQPRNDLEISISFVTNDEYSQIPSYMKGRVQLDNINEFIDVFNVTLNKKYELLKKAKKFKTNADREQCLVWQDQEVGDLKGSYFCNAEDIDKLGNIKIGQKKYMSIITMLRHVKRIKEVRQSKVIYYMACF